MGLEDYANKSCHLLGKLKYSTLKSQNIKDGTIFCTYRTLIGTATGNKTRLKQLVAWCDGEDFDGLILLDECHKAKNILLDADGNAQKVGTAQCSKTAAAVVDLQRLLPRARVVYCSATAVSEPNNLGFMSRLGLWGKGTCLSQNEFEIYDRSSLIDQPFCCSFSCCFYNVPIPGIYYLFIRH